MISSDTTDSRLLGDLQSVTTGEGARRRQEEDVLVHIRASMHDIEHQYHVSMAVTWNRNGKRLSPWKRMKNYCEMLKVKMLKVEHFI